MSTINNIFYVDQNINTMIENIKHGENISINRAGSSTIVSIHQNGERRNIWFKPEESLFTYEVNGHFFGSFFYNADKVTVKWPNRLDDKQKRTLIIELQQMFRDIV